MVEFDRDEAAFHERCVEAGRLPRNDALKQIPLERLAAEFDPGETYTKATVTDLIAEQFDDPVLVRRELVNFGYLRHDNREGTYELIKRRLDREDYRENTRLERHARDIGLLE